ncbi:MAG TPA: hypothetical protein VGZ47_09190 [Gemmataceae bacterium]|jgi:hypothetical protein|nr:hypothetical protein [Gemmataceae bacterium]
MQVFRAFLTLAFLAAPVALLAQDKPKPTEKPDSPKAKSAEEKVLGVLKAISDPAKGDDTKPVKPTEAKPADPKPETFELEFKIVPNPKPDEPKPGESNAEKPEDAKAKTLKLMEAEIRKLTEAEIKEAKAKLLQQQEKLYKASEALLAEAAKKAKAPQQKPGDPQPKPKAIEVQLQYRTEKDGDPDRKLAQLEAQLQALLKEIQTMRAGKETWRVKPTEAKPTPDQPKVLLVPGEIRPRVVVTAPDGGPARVVVPALPGVAPAAKPQPPAQNPPTEASPYRATIRSRLNEKRDGGDIINLTRANYTLPAASAKALDDFLKAQVKAPVLETKVEGDKITVTTTPEVQHIIAQFIALMQGKTPTAAAPGAAIPATVRTEERLHQLDLGERVKEGELLHLQLAPGQKPTETLRLWLEAPAEKKELKDKGKN